MFFVVIFNLRKPGAVLIVILICFFSCRHQARVIDKNAARHMARRLEAVNCICASSQALYQLHELDHVDTGGRGGGDGAEPRRDERRRHGGHGAARPQRGGILG